MPNHISKSFLSRFVLKLQVFPSSAYCISRQLISGFEIGTSGNVKMGGHPLFYLRNLSSSLLFVVAWIFQDRNTVTDGGGGRKRFSPFSDISQSRGVVGQTTSFGNLS